MKIVQKASATLPTWAGQFTLAAYVDEENECEYAVLVTGNVKGKGNVLVRVHSACFTGDIFRSLKCDCHEQLMKSMELVQEKGTGIIIYDREQEGRGMGMVYKIMSYGLQDRGLDTVESAHSLGFSNDLRNYAAAAEILKQMGVKSIELLTNNPDKVEQLKKEGITVVGIIPLRIKPNEFNKKYIETKKAKMGHML